MFAKPMSEQRGWSGAPPRTCSGNENGDPSRAKSMSGASIWEMRVGVYCIPNTAQRVVIPRHHCEMVAEIASSGQEIEKVLFRPPSFLERTGWSSTVTVSDSEVILDGPGMVELWSEFNPKNHPGARTWGRDAIAKALIAVRPVHCDRIIRLEIDLRWTARSGTDGAGLTWEFHGPASDL